MLLVLTIKIFFLCLLISALPEFIILSADNSHAEPWYGSKIEKRNISIHYQMKWVITDCMISYLEWTPTNTLSHLTGTITSTCWFSFWAPAHIIVCIAVVAFGQIGARRQCSGASTFTICRLTVGSIHSTMTRFFISTFTKTILAMFSKYLTCCVIRPTTHCF